MRSTRKKQRPSKKPFKLTPAVILAIIAIPLNILLIYVYVTYVYV